MIRKETSMASYTSIRDSLKTGDLVIFSGKSALSSIIKLFSGGKWSHVGMVLRLPEFDNMILLWESTTLSNITDIETHAATKGVQLVPLSQRINSYDGEINIRQLDKPVTAEMFHALAECRRMLSGKPYEKNELELIRAAYDGIGGASHGEDLSSVFCSELVAEAYQAMGLLPEYPQGLPSNEYTPMDFSSRKNLTLLKDYKLQSEILVSI